MESASLKTLRLFGHRTTVGGIEAEKIWSYLAANVVFVISCKGH